MIAQLITLLGLTLVSVLTYCHVRYTFRYSERNKQLAKLRKAPIRDLPFVRQLWYFLVPSTRFIEVMDDLLSKLETPFVFWFTSYLPVVNLTKAEDIEKFSMLCTNRETFGMSEGVLNGVLSMQNHDEWSKTRRLLNPAFGTIMCTRYLQTTFDGQSKMLVDMLEPEANAGKIFDLHPFLRYINFVILHETLTGVNLNDRGMNEINEYYRSAERFVGLFFVRSINPLLSTNFTFSIYKRFTGMDKEIEKLHALAMEAIVEAKKITTDTLESDAKENSGHSKRGLLIDLLLGAHNRDPSAITEEYIRDEILNFSIAAHGVCLSIGLLILMFGIHQDAQVNQDDDDDDKKYNIEPATYSSSIFGDQNKVERKGGEKWSMWQMISNQERAYQEILSTIPNESQQITMDNMNQLHYLEQCLKETLRVLSSIPIIPRQTLVATTLPSGETIPADTFVLLHNKSVHGNAVFYPDPESWNPANFSAEAIARRPRNSFAVFGFGNRACIGAKFSMLAIKAQAIHILRRYRVYTHLKLNEVVYDRDYMPRIRCGYPVRLEARSPETSTAPL